MSEFADLPISEDTLVIVQRMLRNANERPMRWVTTLEMARLQGWSNFKSPGKASIFVTVATGKWAGREVFRFRELGKACVRAKAEEMNPLEFYSAFDPVEPIGPGLDPDAPTSYD